MAAQRVRFTASTPTTIPRIKSGGRMVPLPRADAQGRKGGAASPPPWSECGRGEGEGARRWAAWQSRRLVTPKEG